MGQTLRQLLEREKTKNNDGCRDCQGDPGTPSHDESDDDGRARDGQRTGPDSSDHGVHVVGAHRVALPTRRNRFTNAETKPRSAPAYAAMRPRPTASPSHLPRKYPASGERTKSSPAVD